MLFTSKQKANGPIELHLFIQPIESICVNWLQLSELSQSTLLSVTCIICQILHVINTESRLESNDWARSSQESF